MKIGQLIIGNKKFKDAKFPKLEGQFDNLVEYGQSCDFKQLGEK